MNENRNEFKKRHPKYMGSVSSWNANKGYGFIRCFDDGQSYFVHCSQLKNDRELVRGAIVEFEIWTDNENPDKKFAAMVLVCEVPEERHNKY